MQVETVGHLFPKPHPVDGQLLNKEVSPPHHLGNSSSTSFKFWDSYGADLSAFTLNWHQEASMGPRTG